MQRPMPVLPAMTAGIQAPLGVTETIQPSLSAAWIEVVPATNASSWDITRLCCQEPSPSASAAGGIGVQPSRRSGNGCSPPWNGYGSPGLVSASLRSQSMVSKRARAYSLESSPSMGSSGG